MDPICSRGTLPQLRRVFLPAIVDSPGNRSNQSQPPIRFSVQQQTPVTGHRAPGEICFDRLAFCV
jgi:hypothetical protein